MFRKQLTQIKKDLYKKIVFLVGPRQVGKTWLSKEIGKYFDKTTYLNYDRFEDREIMKSETWSNSTELLILDELHKMNGWKNYLKGIFDTKLEHLKILVTGSARLDAFRKTGDSLAGRFFIHHLMPFSMAELNGIEEGDSIDRFIERGSFPEPFLADSLIDSKRWRNQYIDGLIRNDILNFEKIDDYQKIKTIFELLRRSVGSPISYNSIARDVELSPKTVQKYISILEALYIIFKITPYSNNIARSILKKPKIYFFDTALVVGDDGVKFENFIAFSLLKNIYGLSDYCGEEKELHYLRTKEGKEVDFAISSWKKIETIIEAKLKKSVISKNLLYFCEKYNLNGIQLVKNLKHERTVKNIEILRAEDYLKKLYL